jgi:hypothetical protein
VKEFYREGFVYRVYIADEKDCQRCPLRLRGLSARGAKWKYVWVPISVKLTNLSGRMAGKIDT